MDKLLSQHFILNNIPFDVIQTSPFIHFVQGVAAYGSGYEVPSYLTLRTELISNLRIEVEAAQTKKRNRLESKMLDDDLVYMRMNTMMWRNLTPQKVKTWSLLILTNLMSFLNMLIANKIKINRLQVLTF